MPYKYLEDMATADVAFEVEAGSLEELFRDAALATFEVMADTRTIKPKVTRKIELHSEDEAGLFFDWLAELVYIKDVEGLIFCGFDVNIRKNGNLKLRATASGEEIDPERHSLRSDVKAVTYHMFEIRKVLDKWIARVVLDI